MFDVSVVINSSGLISPGEKTWIICYNFHNEEYLHSSTCVACQTKGNVILIQSKSKTAGPEAMTRSFMV